MHLAAGRTRWGANALPRPLAAIRWPTSKGEGWGKTGDGDRSGREGMGKEEMGSRDVIASLACVRLTGWPVA